jgi:hypothetical protein
MFWEQITKTWVQLVSKTAAVRGSAPQIDPEPEGSVSNSSAKGAVYDEAATEPYIPANNARLSEDSLHLSC